MLQAIVHLDFQNIRDHERVDIYPLIAADFMLLENQVRPGRHADFHGGVQCICDPSTLRSTIPPEKLLSSVQAAK